MCPSGVSSRLGEKILPAGQTGKRRSLCFSAPCLSANPNAQQNPALLKAKQMHALVSSRPCYRVVKGSRHCGVLWELLLLNGQVCSSSRVEGATWASVAVGMSSSQQIAKGHRSQVLCCQLKRDKVGERSITISLRAASLTKQLGPWFGLSFALHSNAWPTEKVVL